MINGFVHWLRDRIPFSLLLSLYYLYCRLRYSSPQEQTRRQFYLPSLDEIDLASNKCSDKLFVLASGPSINRISPEIRWKRFHQIKERVPLLRPKLYLPYRELQAIATL
jgi:hypothetical protein